MKKSGVAYGLFAVAGIFGLHSFYLKRWLIGGLHLLLLGVFVATFIVSAINIGVAMNQLYLSLSDSATILSANFSVKDELFRILDTHKQGIIIGFIVAIIQLCVLSYELASIKKRIQVLNRAV